MEHRDRLTYLTGSPDLHTSSLVHHLNEQVQYHDTKEGTERGAHLTPVSKPSYHPRYSEQDGEEVHWESHRAVNQSTVAPLVSDDIIRNKASSITSYNPKETHERLCVGSEMRKYSPEIHIGRQFA